MIELLITSSVLILTICLLRVLLKGKMNPKVQYALWLLVVIRLLPLSMISGASLPKIESKASVMNLVSSEGSKSKNYKDDTVTPLVKENTTLTEMENVKEQIPLRSILLTIYVIGVFAACSWFFYVNIRFARNLKRNRSISRNVDCKLPVYTVHNLKTSCVFLVGGRCGIYLTEDSAKDPTKQRYVIAHELCHYKHFDQIWSMVRCFFLVIYWFDPFVWMAAYLSKLDCEMACDTSVIETFGETERLSYGKTLVDIAAMQNERGSVISLAASMSENNRGLKLRIEQIVKKPKMMVTSILVLILLVGAAATVTFTSKVHSSPSNEKTVSTALENNYSLQNAALDGFNTNIQSVSYDKFKGSKCLGTITVKEDTKLKGTTKNSGEAIQFVLVSPSKEQVILNANTEFDLDLPAGEYAIYMIGDVGQGSVSINYEKNEKVKFEAKLDELHLGEAAVLEGSY